MTSSTRPPLPTTPYLDPIDLPALGTPTISRGVKTYPTISIYLPEHFVSHPVFGAQDLNGMTYLEITYTSRWTTDATAKVAAKEDGYPEPQSGKCYFRIAGGTANTANHGQIRRNAVLYLQILSERKFQQKISELHPHQRPCHQLNIPICNEKEFLTDSQSHGCSQREAKPARHSGCRLADGLSHSGHRRKPPPFSPKKPLTTSSTALSSSRLRPPAR